jgi:ABC-type Fe3+ transport system permease subunit
MGIVAVLTLNQFNIPSLLQVRTWTSDLFITFSATLEWQEIHKSILLLVAGSTLFLLIIRGNVIRWPSASENNRLQTLKPYFHPRVVILLKCWTVLWVFITTILPCTGLIFSSKTWHELSTATAAGQSALSHSLGFGIITATCLSFTWFGDLLAGD